MRDNESMIRGRDDYQMDYEPAPRITEADKTNDRKYDADFSVFFHSIFSE